MELMIVLLVVSIIAATTAPMIARKSARSAGGSGSAVGYLGIGQTFGNPSQDNGAALVLGANRIPNNTITKTFLNLTNAQANNNNSSHIAFGVNGAVTGILKILGNSGISLGNRANGSGQNSIAIGTGAIASGENSVAIGNGATAGGTDSVAIGHNANTNNKNHCVVISTGNTIDNKYIDSNRIIIGGENDTVVIPGEIIMPKLKLGAPGTTTTIAGNLLVQGILAKDNQFVYYDGQSKAYNTIRKTGHGADYTVRDNVSDVYKHDGYEMDLTKIKPLLKQSQVDYSDPGWSDRRLKNVGEKFTGGLDEIKKLDLYNFTFKSDKAKTPQVGVMAQDLQKVFPNSVWEGADKYLRIRWDEMFYAVINAVKELDTKITTAVEEIKANTNKTEELQAQLDEEREINKSQQKVIADLEKRIAKLEKKREFKQKQE